MKRINLIFWLSLLLLAPTFINAQEIKNLPNYKHFTASEIAGDLEVVYGSIKAMNGEQYVSEITEVERAACYDVKDFKKFLKDATKAVKKADIPLILESPQDIDYKTKLYAKEGTIVVLTEMDNEFASIAIVRGKP